MRIARNKITISLALVAALLLSSETVSAQLSTAPTSDWSRLNAVTAGSKVSVKLKSGKTVDGKLSWELPTPRCRSPSKTNPST